MAERAQVSESGRLRSPLLPYDSFNISRPVFSWKMEITSPLRGAVIPCDRVKFSVQCLAHSRSLYAQFPSFTKVLSCPLHKLIIFHRCHQNILCSNGVVRAMENLRNSGHLVAETLHKLPFIFFDRH